MRHVSLSPADLAGFRDAARTLLADGVPPDDVHFGEPAGTLALPARGTKPAAPATLRVSRAFVDEASRVVCHRDPDRYAVLYRLAWRMSHGESRLMEVSVDPDVRRFAMMTKAVSRDVHKMHAFVRFRRLADVADDPVERFAAWHRPDHFILRIAAPFFVERFGVMRWWIVTPDASAAWDGDSVHYGPGAPGRAAPPPDAFEDLWKRYYASIFNPARLAPKAMRKEMPKRHWATLPEASLVETLLREAPARAARMVAPVDPAHVVAARVPPRATLPVLREAALACDACELCGPATQVVFGEGPANARMVLVGEQPGDEEDLAGRPFIGPAGALLDRALGDAGIVRAEAYLTNAVKHFRHRRSGRMRIHERPRVGDVQVCRPWLDAELMAIEPRIVVCLGNTAARALLGPAYHGESDRGRVHRRAETYSVLPTYHPAAILRAVDSTARTAMYDELVDALRRANEVAAR